MVKCNDQTVEQPHPQCDLNTRHLIKIQWVKAGFFDTKISADRLKIRIDSANRAVEWEFVHKSSLGAVAADRRCGY